MENGRPLHETMNSLSPLAPSFQEVMRFGLGVILSVKDLASFLVWFGGWTSGKITRPRCLFTGNEGDGS